MNRGGTHRWFSAGLGALAAHTVQARHPAYDLIITRHYEDPLQYSRIPWQIHVDDRVRRLKVEPSRARVGREERATCRVTLKLVHQLLPLLLRD